MTTSDSAAIVPIRGVFEDLRAMLGALAADAANVGFVGVVKRDDGTMVPVNFGVTRGDVSFAAALLIRDSVDPGDQPA